MNLITEPGIYPGIDESRYHADDSLAPELGRSLSQSGAKSLLIDQRIFLHDRDHGRPPKTEFDDGSLVHALVLRNKDNRIRVVDAENWTGKGRLRADLWMQGLIPVTRAQLRRAAKVARAVRRNQLAMSYLTGGLAEASFYWRDPTTGVTCRGRTDYYIPGVAIVDIKTVGRRGGSRFSWHHFGRSAADFDYPLQAATYIEAVATLTGERLPFITITVEMDEPYIVRVGEYDDIALTEGLMRWHRACQIYATGEEHGWPGLEQTEPELIDVPEWYLTSDMEI